jgi:dTDP-4-amino-4,6-dideoxygalactose transaminase
VIPITRPELPPLEEYRALLEQIWSSRMLSNFGSFAQGLERLASEYLGVETKVAVSGDIGLTLAISCFDLPASSTCLVPSFTFNSTVSAVLWNRLRPVFVDIDPETLTLDVAHTAALAREHRPSLIIATHVFGNPADVDGLSAVAASTGARLLFDSAHGYGSRRGGVPVGNFGDAEVFSLSGTKPVTTAEGGLVSSRDSGFLSRFVHARAYGFQHDYNSKRLGLNGKMSELHAALGLLTLRRIEDALERRAAHVQAYRARLGRLAGLHFQKVRAEDRSSSKDFAVLFPAPARRDRVEAALQEAAVQTKRYFRPCHRMDAFATYATGALGVTDDVYARILCLPLFESLTPAQIDQICTVVERNYG